MTSTTTNQTAPRSFPMTDRPDHDSMTDLDWIVWNARREVEATRLDLVEAMERLAADLAREAGRLRDNPDRTVNSLGVVQGRGANVDRLCALLDERRKGAAHLRCLVAPTIRANRSRVHPTSTSTSTGAGAG
jgi:hypothetical protein